MLVLLGYMRVKIHKLFSLEKIKLIFVWYKVVIVRRGTYPKSLKLNQHWIESHKKLLHFGNYYFQSETPPDTVFSFMN